MKWRALWVAGLIGLASGCQTTESRTAKGLAGLFGKEEEPPAVRESEFHPPARLVAVWTDAVYTEPKAAPTRGFGGRLYFYAENGDAVPVEGQLVVYGYDDSAEGEAVNTPSRKFVFTPEQFTTHYTPSDLGASYSVWIPWDEVGGERRSISLVPVFTSTQGKIVMGQQTMNVLPGKPPAGAAPRPALSSSSSGTTAVQPAAYQAGTVTERQSLLTSRDQWQQQHNYVPSGGTKPQLRATTIPVPQSITERLMTPASDIAGRPAGPLERSRSGQRNPAQPSSQLEVESTGWRQPPQDAAAASPQPPITASPRLTPPAARFAHPRYLAPRAASSPRDPARAATPPGLE